MTREECLIVSAYTKILMVPFPDLQEFVEDTLGRPVMTHEMTSHDFWVELQDILKPRFLELCWGYDAE